jgi:hypothetical protein
VRRAKPSVTGDKRRAGRKNALPVRKDMMVVREEEHDCAVLQGLQRALDGIRIPFFGT